MGGTFFRQVLFAVVALLVGVVWLFSMLFSIHPLAHSGLPLPAQQILIGVEFLVGFAVLCLLVPQLGLMIVGQEERPD